MKNFLSMDVEDYLSLFHRDALGVSVPVSGRAADCTRRMLDLIEGSGARATCFCLSAVAAAFPALVREIHERGFEVGSHGKDHILYSRSGTAEIKRDLTESKAALEDLIGAEVAGFRAPAFNVSLERPEVVELIIEAGYKYDSSIFPIRGRRYGSPWSPRRPHLMVGRSGDLAEFPLATFEAAGRRIPAAGGGYLRHFPFLFNRMAISSINREGIPATVYLHPYECDAERFEYPAGGIGLAARARAMLSNASQYHGRAGTMSKLSSLLREFEFITLGQAFRAMEPEVEKVNLWERTGGRGQEMAAHD